MAPKKSLPAPTMSTEVLKALANPLRHQVWREVSRLRFARAADLADSLEVPANTLSFHLRVLADAGLIEEAPKKARDRRDRVWKPTSGQLSLGSPDDPVADVALGNAVLAASVAGTQDQLARIAKWASSFVTGEDPVERGTLAEARLRLTRERHHDLIEELHEVIARYRDDPSDDDLSWSLTILSASEEI